MSGGSAMFGRCPACGEGKVYKGWMQLHDKCNVCGVVYQRDPGSWTGATVVGYMVGAIFACLLIMVMWMTGRLFEPGANWIVALSTVAFQLLVLHFVKGIWVGILYEGGFVYADPEPSTPEPPPESPSS